MRSAVILIGIFTFESQCQYAITFHKTKETLNTIQHIIMNQKKGAYLRFGDGDINLALGTSELLQNANTQLTNEMTETFSLNGPTILKCLPLHCKEFGGYEKGMFPGNHEAPYDWSLAIYNKAQGIWGSSITDVYSPVALSFAAVEYIDDCISFLKFLKSQNCLLLVGNKNIPLHIKNILFNGKY